MKDILRILNKDDDNIKRGSGKRYNKTVGFSWQWLLNKENRPQNEGGPKHFFKGRSHYLGSSLALRALSALGSLLPLR